VRDILVSAALLLGFATLVTVHVAVCARLVIQQEPRWRGLVAFAVPPLAVVWGYRAGYRRSVGLWIVAVVVYTVALIAALT